MDSKKVFEDFIIECAKEEDREEARVLIEDSFVKMEEGRITTTYVKNLIPNMLSHIKPDRVDEVKKVMEQYGHDLNV